jgi:hypothetical protein
MYFDRLAGLLERHLPSFTHLLADANIFRLNPPTLPNTALPSDSPSDFLDAWEPDERTVQNFRLPFAKIALETAVSRHDAADSCIVLILKDLATREIDFLLGFVFDDIDVIAKGTFFALPDVDTTLSFSSTRTLLMSQMSVWRGNKKKGVQQLRFPIEWIQTVQFSMLKREISTSARVVSTLKSTDSWSKLKAESLFPLVNEERTKCFILQVKLLCERAVIGILIINEPACFIVEERLLNEPRSSNLPITRSTDKPHFIVLTPHQIRTRFMSLSDTPSSEDDDTKHVTPHERRGHYRTLRSERYKAARGRTIWIDPVWVGPTEAIKGKNRYLVRLDL